ncbi:hypothetical protein DFH28DRAFT_888642, partial [Melampsora americana]
VPWYESLPNLGRKEEGCLYRMLPKPFRQNELFYSQYDDVTVLEDHIVYKVFNNITNDDEWSVRKIFLNHREARGWYFLKFGRAWKTLVSQGRRHCFDRAQSSRYASMVLKSFQDALFTKMRNNFGVINLVHQQWFSNSVSMKSAGTLYIDEPRWMICEGMNDERSHRFVSESRFINEPFEPYIWTDLIYAFVHYAYDLSNGRSLIYNLDCDEHGSITNVQCFTKDDPPYHIRNDPGAAEKINSAFVNFTEQHRCNLICQHLGNISP